MASVVHVIVGLGNGGAEKTLLKVCSLDEKNSHSIISLTGSGHHGQPLRASGGHLHCMGLRVWNLLSVIKRIRRLRCVTEADIITAWMPHAILLSPLYAGKTRNPKLVINLRASSYGQPLANFFRNLLLLAWSLRFGEMVDAVITPGKATGKSHQGLFIGKEKFQIIHNGFQQPENASVQELLSTSEGFLHNGAKTPGVLHIGMFARWHPQKNHSGFLRALLFLDQDGLDFKAVMAGSKVEWSNKRLSRRIYRYGLQDKVELLGNFETLKGIIERVDVHVVASSYGEAFPNIAAETMIEGVANIVTDVGDSATVIGDTGWLVEPGSSHALYLALKECMGSTAELRSKGQSARERIQSSFPAAKMIQEYSDLYRSLGH